MNHLKETILLVSLFLMNAAGFLVMFIDKQKARRDSGADAAAPCGSGRQRGEPFGNVSLPSQDQTSEIHFGDPPDPDFTTSSGLAFVPVSSPQFAPPGCTGPLQTTIPLPAGQAAGRGIDSALNSSCPYDRLGQPETVKCIENTWDMAWTK